MPKQARYEHDLPRPPGRRPKTGDAHADAPVHTRHTEGRTADMAEIDRRRSRTAESLRPAFSHLVDLSARVPHSAIKEYGFPEAARRHAVSMVELITDIRRQGGWTSSERGQLRCALRKWERRAEGLDARYTLYAQDGPTFLRPQQRDHVAILQTAVDVKARMDAVVAKLAQGVEVTTALDLVLGPEPPDDETIDQDDDMTQTERQDAR